VRGDARRPEGPDADWIHLPDPIAEAIQGLASRIGALEQAVANLSGGEVEDSSGPAERVGADKSAATNELDVVGVGGDSENVDLLHAENLLVP